MQNFRTLGQPLLGEKKPEKKKKEEKIAINRSQADQKFNYGLLFRILFVNKSGEYKIYKFYSKYNPMAREA